MKLRRINPRPKSHLDYFGHRQSELVVDNGHFGDGAFWFAQNPTIGGGRFGDDSFWSSVDPTILGGDFGYGTLRDANGVCVLNPYGSFKGIYPPRSGIIVARAIGELNGDDPHFTDLKIYAVEGPSDDRIKFISRERLAHIMTIVRDRNLSLVALRKHLLEIVQEIAE